MPGTINNVHVVTGIPFAATFGSGVNTFTVAGNYTSMFGPNGILTVIGGSPNGGYRKITSAVFSAGNTTVTSTSYSTGTAYPGPTNFTSGSGTVILFSDIAAPSPSLVVIGPSVNGTGGPLYSGEMNGFSDGQVSGGSPNYNAGSSVGSLVSGTVFGVQVQGILYEDGGSDPQHSVMAILYGSHAQNFFSSMSFTDTTPALETFLSSAASYSVITGTNGTFTVWEWTAIQNFPFGFGPNVTVTFNP